MGRAAAATDGYKGQESGRCREGNAGGAIPGLLDDLVVTPVLRSEHFDDPADLARLPAVSRAMRDLVAATGFRFKELDADHAVILGCLSAVRRLQRGGKLSRQELLCHAAARGGHLQQLQESRETGCPWNEHTSSCAATRGHLEVIQCSRAHRGPWHDSMSANAAPHGHP